MPEVVELRVHGVGGAAPEALLGVEGPADVVQVAAEGPSTFHARRLDRRVEGYVWGKLTSNALLQPLWLFLLPFTLMNVAGWMHLPNDRLRWGRRTLLPFRALRVAILVLSLALTLSYVFWSANILINKVNGLHSFLGITTPQVKILVGWALVVAVILAFLYVARSTQTAFEAFEGPGHLGARSEPARAREPAPATGQAQMLKSMIDPATAGRVVAETTAEERLTDPSFWARPRGAALRLYLHVAVALLAAAALLPWILARADHPDGLRLATFATYTTEAMLWSLFAVAAIHFFGWKGSLRTDGFRWGGPLVAAATSVGLSTGFFYGMTLWLLNDPGRVGELGTAFGISALGWAVGLVGLAVWARIRSRAERRRAQVKRTPEFVRVNEGPKGRELNGVTARMLRKVALHRALAEGGRNADLVLFLSQAGFVAAALLNLRTGVLRGIEVIGTVGNWVALSGAVGILSFLLYRSFRPSERRLVGIVWEVLTFWPRRFHPLAVRPYAERAVPELQQRLWHHVLDEGRRVVLSAHSQGTIIAYAALAQLAAFPKGRELTGNVALLTYGCPLRQLYAWAFPAYFSEKDFRALRRHLFTGEDPRSPWAWRNFYRHTDYIGKRIFEHPDLTDFEEVIPDPAEKPVYSAIPLELPLDPPWPDPPRTAWMNLARHSFYNQEHPLKEWLDKLRVELSR